MTSAMMLDLFHDNEKTLFEGLQMATMVTGNELRRAVESGEFIKDGDPGSVEGVKYDFHLSNLVLKAKFKRPIDFNTLSEAEKRDLEVEPGEVVFVLTQERLSLPLDVVAQLSPKRKLSHAGILTLGGLCVDPGYEGRLLIGLCNFSSTPFPIIPGKKVIAATFFRLNEAESAGLQKPGESLVDFPDDLIQVMQRYKPIAVAPLESAITELRSDVEGLRRDIRSHEDWYTRFKDSLDTHNQQIGDLSRDLRSEIEARRAGEDKLSSAVWWAKAVAFVLAAVFAAALGLLGAWLAGWLPQPSHNNPPSVSSPAPPAPAPATSPHP
jgi:deoxycytidine triphosphate deaminase